MPWSSSHHYVHVAIPKTGTTSLVRALGDLHRREGGTVELVNDEVTPAFRLRHGLDRLGDPQPGHAKHLSAVQLRSILGADEFDRCFVFSVVRNPWERMVSRYNFTHERSEPSEEDKLRRGTGRTFHDLEFDAWLERVWRRHQKGRGPRTQLSKLIDLDGRLLVDHVGRLTDIQGTVDALTTHLGVDPVPVVNVNPSSRTGSYADHYDDHTRELVAEIHRVDIDYFGFTFDELVAPAG
jgi:chondroitin 4-sulfotransferase 11